MESRERLVALAIAQLGKPYTYGARPYGVDGDFDCSSLVQYLYKDIGIDLPRTTLEQIRCGSDVTYGRDLLAGDLIFIRGSSGRYDAECPKGVGHVYVVTDPPHEAIHAQRVSPDVPGSVIRENLAGILSRSDIVAIRRILVP